MSQAEFHEFAASFKSIIDPDLGRIAFVNDKPAGFALAFPDFNQALNMFNGRLDLLGILKLLWFSRHLERVSFKKSWSWTPNSLAVGSKLFSPCKFVKRSLRKKYKEVDMSLTGDENLKSNRYQERLGMTVYRRYRIYEKEI